MNNPGSVARSDTQPGDEGKAPPRFARGRLRDPPPRVGWREGKPARTTDGVKGSNEVPRGMGATLAVTPVRRTER